MIRINLLPVRVSKKKAAGKQQLLLFAVLVLAGFVGNFLWASSRAEELAARQAKVAKTKEEIAQLDRIIGEVKNIKEQQGALREKLDVLAELKANRSGPVRMLDALATVTPKRLWLAKLEEKGGVMTFSGAAATIDDVSEFMSALKKSAHFSSVELTRTSARAERRLEVVDFVLTAAVHYGTKKATPGAPPAPGAPGGK
jgi:type IV pilus assembly protein PilN